MERRIAATKMVGKLLATAEGRKYFKDNGFKSGQSLVVADYDEQIKDVLPRVKLYAPPVTIALIKGEGESEELVMFSVEPTDERPKGSSKANSDSTIGMLYEASKQVNHGTVFQVSKWDSVSSAISMPSVRELLAH